MYGRTKTLEPTHSIVFPPEINSLQIVNVFPAFQAATLNMLLTPLPTPNVVSSFRFRPTSSTQYSRNPFFQTQSGKVIGDCFLLIPRQVSTLRIVRSHKTRNDNIA